MNLVSMEFKRKTNGELLHPNWSAPPALPRRIAQRYAQNYLAIIEALRKEILEVEIVSRCDTMERVRCFTRDLNGNFTKVKEFLRRAM